MGAVTLLWDLGQRMGGEGRRLEVIHLSQPSTSVAVAQDGDHLLAITHQPRLPTAMARRAASKPSRRPSWTPGAGESLWSFSGLPGLFLSSECLPSPGSWREYSLLWTSLLFQDQLLRLLRLKLGSLGRGCRESESRLALMRLLGVFLARLATPLARLLLASGAAAVSRSESPVLSLEALCVSVLSTEL